MTYFLSKNFNSLIFFKYYIALSVVLIFVLPLTVISQPQIPNPDFYVTNGIVYAMAVDGDYTYIGGSFTYVGMNTGYGIKLTTTSPVPSANYPKVNGEIKCVESDGSGGWYIGGDFSKVGTYSLNYLAHINSDGTVNSSWNPNPNSTVHSIKKDGSNIYVGGNFTSIGGLSRKAIAKLNNTNGNADASWNANLDQFSPTVYTIAITGSNIYIGGSFTSINSTTVNRIAKLSLSDGNLNSEWNANSNNLVKKILVSGNFLFVCGDFSNIGGQSRSKIAKLNITDGNAENWNANQNGAVYDIALSIDGNALYVGGSFNTIGGATRYRLAKLNISDATADASWNPTANHDVYSLAVTDDAVYVGGYFSFIGGIDAYRFAKLNTTNGNGTSNWTPTTNTYPNAIAVNGSDIYAGGNFSSAGGKFQNYVARINNINGKLDENWLPSGFGVVYSIELGTTYIYFGGDSFIKRYVRTTGDLDLTWVPIVDNTVRTILPDESNNAIYLGGDFNYVNSAARNYLAKINNSSGANDNNWIPNSNARVRSLILYNSYIIAAGDFTNIGGQTRNHIAKINSTNGNVESWDPNANNNIWDLAIIGSYLYLGGGFTEIGGQSRNRLAKYDLSTELLDGTWNPNSDGWIYTLTTNSVGSVIYVGGGFFNIGGSNSIYYLAKLNNTTGNAENWDVDCGYYVYSIVTNQEDVYAGGEFNSIGGELQPRIVLFTSRTLPIELISFSAKFGCNSVNLNWQTTSEVRNYGFYVECKAENDEWKTIGFVQGAGNSNSPKFYSFNHLNPPIGKIKYRLKQIDIDGIFSYSDEIEIEHGAPKEFALHQNYPNPFNPSTLINYNIPQAELVTLKVCNILGKEVAILLNERKEAGRYSTELNAAKFGLSSGVYFYTLVSGSFISTKKMIMMK